MKIAIIGYGRMGKTIERIAKDKGHEIVFKIGSRNSSDLNVDRLKDSKAEVAIEFSVPTSALSNIMVCMEAKVPVVCGTTAWLDNWDQAIESMLAHEGAFLYASNFSIGVNIFFAINQRLASIMNSHRQYKPSIHEVHHTGKLDAPSGTAITLADGITENINSITSWSSDKEENKIQVTSERIDPAPGTHHVTYSSDIDEIEIIHTAKSREGFALGAVLAAEYIVGKKGLHSMTEVLGI